MKMVKSLLLGIAAGLVAISGASAADFTKAKPVQYVKICSLIGSPAAPVIGANGSYDYIAAMNMSAKSEQGTFRAGLDQAMKLDYGVQVALTALQSTGSQDNGNMAKWATGYGGASFTPPTVGQQSAAPALHAAQVVGTANTITAPGRDIGSG